MASNTNITFVDYQTIVPATWLNFINQTANDIFDVKAYGAKGNGVADDTNAILATITAAGLAGGGIVFLPPGTYNISSPLTIAYNYVSIRGAGQGSTTINQVTANTNGINAIGTQGSPLTSLYFSDFDITAAVTGGTTNFGIALNYTALARLESIQVTNFSVGIDMIKATNTFFYKMGVASTVVQNNMIGWAIFGNNNPPGGNESSTWRDCYVQGTANLGSTGQIGFHVYGAYVSDLYFSNCATAETNYGYFLDYSTAAAGGYADIIIHNPVVDGYTTQGIAANNMPQEQKLTIIGGWINSAYTGVGTAAIYLNQCVGQVSVTGTQIEGEGNLPNVEGVQLIGSGQTTVSGCMFSNCTRAIYETNSFANVYSNNVIFNTQPNQASNMMYLQGSNGSMVIGNSFSGYANSIVMFDNTSSSGGIVGNTATTCTASSRFANNSSNPVGGATGSTGLNIGY